MGPRVGFEIFKNKKISCPCRELNPDRPAPGQLTVPTALFRLVNLQTVFLNSMQYVSPLLSPFVVKIDRLFLQPPLPTLK